MSSLAEALAVAMQHHQAGRLAEAERIYRQILQVAPDHAGANHLLGAIAHEAGRHEAAIELIRRAIGLQGDVPAFHRNLGAVHHALRQLPEAVACYRRALDLDPNFTVAHYNLGNALKDLGRLDEAAACFRRAVQLEPALAEAHNNLGGVLHGLGRADEAVECFHHALRLKPDYAQALSNLGHVLQGQGKLDDALACGRRAVQLEPGDPQLHDNLGAILRQQGNLDEAVACHRRAVQLKPDFAAAHNNLGIALGDQGHAADALACHRHAVQLEPDFAAAHNDLGAAFSVLGDLEEAAACYRRALALKPDFAVAHYNLGNALKEQGKLAEALDSYRRALQLRPDYVQAHSNRLVTLQFCPGVTPADLAQAHAQFDRACAMPLVCASARRPPAPDRQGPLRVGFVSPDLWRHPVGYFLVRVLEGLRRGNLETICYSDRSRPDDLTRRLQAAATGWRQTSGLNDQRLADAIRADRIDILFDLAGHTARNRLLVFARSPAPLQITWIGYEGTTGLSAMDCLLADRYMVPAGTDHYYREQVLRMPAAYVCYDPPAEAPPVGPLPAREPGEVTFGSFNNGAKIAPQVVKLWAEILRRLPRARLALKYWGLDKPSAQQRFRQLFADCGIAPKRLSLLPPSGFTDYLAAYRQVDLALDTFPFSGGATTCEALWMGVPVVTCPGETFASRHSFSHLSNVGLTETIARDFDEYVEIAVGLAHDLPRLAAIRARLRTQMAAAPLCDGPRFAANLTELLRDVWQRRGGGKG